MIKRSSPLNGFLFAGTLTVLVALPALAQQAGDNYREKLPYAPKPNDR